VLSHATARDWLIPYADGMLAHDERGPIDAHLAGCASCAAELGEVRELNLLLVSLPPAPPVPFAAFWSELQAKLPQPRLVRAPRESGYRRLGLAFAIATVAALASMGAAFAAPSALPDNPLYPIKQLEEGVRLAFTPSDGKLAAQVDLAAERLSEAEAMAANHQQVLALNSLRSFDVLLGDASEELSHPTDPRVAVADLHRLRTDLDAVEEANASRGDDDSNVKQSVLASIGEVDKVEQEEKDNTTPPVVTPTPHATPTPRPTERETPRPTPTSESGDEHQRTEAR